MSAGHEPHGHVESSGKTDGGFIADVHNALIPDFKDLIAGSKGIGSVAKASGASLEGGMGTIKAVMGPITEIVSGVNPDGSASSSNDNAHH